MDENKKSIGEKYNKIAEWWNIEHKNSRYVMDQISKALSFCNDKDFALDVGCGSGGRIINELLNQGFKVTGVDASEKMIELAKVNHKNVEFFISDICEWQTQKKFNFIVAWDSIFHLPINSQKTVISKLCNLLNPKGILIYTFGDAYGEHKTKWHDEYFPYSSIGINENLQTIIENDCKCIHLELDQYPSNHVYIIAQK